MPGSAPRLAAMLLVLLGGSLGAGPLEVSLDRDRVQVGETFHLVVAVEGHRDARVQPPRIPEGLEVLGSSQGHEIYSDNGRITQRTTVRYSLRALRAGTWVIPPVKALLGSGGSVLGPAKEVVVDPPRRAPKDKGDASERGPLFAEFSLEPSRVYMGEPVALYSRVYLRDNFQFARPAQLQEGRFEGFRVDQVEVDATTARVEQLPAGRFYVMDVDRKILAPLQEGALTVMAGGPVVTVRRAEAPFRMRRPFTAFDSFFGAPSKQMALEIPAQVVDVLPVPTQGRPPDWDGLVGRHLELEVRADSDRGEVGEPIHLRIEVRGQADLRGLREVPVEFPSSVTVFDTKGEREMTWRAEGPRSAARFDVVLVPNQPGTLELPAVEIPWFDAVNQRYARLQAPGPKLEIEGGAPVPARPAASVARTVPGARLEPASGGRTLRFLREAPGPWVPRRGPLHARPEGLGLLGVLVVLALGVEAWARRRERFAGDAAGLRASRALRQARAALGDLDPGDSKAFYGGLASLLREYVAAKFRRETGGLRAEEFAELLRQGGVPGEVVDQGQDLLERAEEARYARVARGSPERDLVLVRGWLGRVEGSLR